MDCPFRCECILCSVDVANSAQNEDSAAAFRQTPEFRAYLFLKFLRPSFFLLLASVPCGILVKYVRLLTCVLGTDRLWSCEPGTIKIATTIFLGLTCFFNACHTTQIILTVKSSIVPGTGDVLTKAVRAVLWFLKGAWRAVAQFWRNDEDTRLHGKVWILLARAWLALIVVLSCTIWFGLNPSPQALQVSNSTPKDMQADQQIGRLMHKPLLISCSVSAEATKIAHSRLDRLKSSFTTRRESRYKQ